MMDAREAVMSDDEGGAAVCDWREELFVVFVFEDGGGRLSGELAE
jgi:hypothetical protein